MDFDGILVIGAHPDDAVLGCGGTIAKFGKMGLGATILCVTNGENGGDPQRRRKEEANAAARLGSELLFGDLPDCGIQPGSLMSLISDVIERTRPKLVFVHDGHDTHQDHIAISQAAARVCRKTTNLLFYEGPSTVHFRPTISMNIADVWQSKCDALQHYASQNARLALSEWTEVTARFRASPRFPNGLCESYVSAHIELTNLLFGSDY